MTYFKDALKCLALAAASFALFWVGLFFAHLSQTAEDIGGTALAGRLLIGQLRAELPIVSASLDAKATRALDQAALLRSDLNSRLDILSGKLDAPLDAATAVLDAAAGIRQDIAPLLDEAAGTAAIARLTIKDLRPQLLGLVAGWKIVGGETATAMREIQRATPQAIVSFQAVQGSIQRSSAAIELGIPRFIENTNGIAANVRQLTKPRWWDSLAKDAAAGALVYGNVK